MSAADFTRTMGRRARQRGVAAIEFAICGVIFFMLVFGIIELARVMYICNTLQEVTRRAAAFAANADFSNPAAMQRVRERAIFRDSPGQLLLADPVSDEHIKIDYLWIPLSATTPVAFTGILPASPELNRENCMTDPNGANCIRLVRVRICMPESNDCDAVPYKTLISFIPMPFGLPTSTTVVHAETLGLAPRLPPG